VHQDTLADYLEDSLKLLARGGLAALACGVIAGLAAAPACFGSAVPLILAAEEFEAPCDPGAESCDDEGPAAFMPADGAERDVCTLTSVAWFGFAYAALVIGGLLVRGARLGPSTGLKLGLLGFATVQLLPALGLSPELPGMLAAEVSARQMWAGGQMGAGLLGAWLALGELPSQWVYKALGRAARFTTTVAGALVGILPLLVGAPHPAYGERSEVPAELAARFACASLLTTFCFWLVLGQVCALAVARVDPALAPDTEATEALGQTSSSAAHLVEVGAVEVAVGARPRSEAGGRARIVRV
jgi:cobalt transporter subunit CbtA